ncbi:NADPH-cytochrome P450 reductase [Ceratobasidium sp. 392]|nr:NADPH-cytochrome P450 reductase [Ceratobasidium sp. 392]
MSPLSTNDIAVIGVGIGLTTAYLFREQIFGGNNSKTAPALVGKGKSLIDQGDPRDFVAKMIASKKRLVIFYGSQTGTAEEYAIRLAKEAKSRFGIGSLVCDPEEYDFNKLDDLPENCAVVFVVATYGEGEPTDNAVELMSNLTDDSFEFSKGEHRLEGLKYIVFGLGNKTYEHYNKVARDVDEKLSAMGGLRIGDRGEGDDDKSMEEDYLEWKEKLWPEFARIMQVEEGAGGETPDFKVTEVDTHPPEKVYLGELSARALTKTRGIHDAKNPYPSPVQSIRELFTIGGERNCVHAEFNIEGSGITYQHGDHVGLWPSNPDVESQEGIESVTNPIYAISGPRSSYKGDVGFKAPIHVRRSTFRLPTNPKTPVIMIGPGTGVAPFRGFVQERVALARKAIEKNGPDALADWGQISLYYGCRHENEDFLYKDEWPGYAEELKGKFVMRNAFSRSGPRKPDGSKIYVQDLLWEDRAAVSDAINDKRGYVYICGEAKNMSKAVEDVLVKIFNEAGKNGAEELKTMKERSRLLLDVWS